jgi:oligopeptide/dipeptide ABC transporter ATP-binding protein
MSAESRNDAQASPLLSVRGLSVGFDTMEGQVTAVDRLSFEVNRGETLGLVGESGCGKSVTALSILRLLTSPPARQKGRIEFEGRNLLALNSEAMRGVRGRDISMIFQEPMSSLNPVMTIGGQITEAVMAHGGGSKDQAWRKAVEMLQKVQIPSPRQRAREYPHRMSGGMRQRAMIAMALCCKPRLLLADEPTTALDVTIQAQIMALMLRLRDEFQTSMVLITHDLGLIAEMAQRVVVMYAGQLVEEARVKELFKDPLHPYTRGLLGSIPVLGRKFEKGRSSLLEIKGTVPSLRDMPIGCRFRPRCAKASEQCCQDPPLLSKDKGRKVRCWLWM